MLPTIHWLPVIGSAVAVFAIGALWYSPILLGKAWVKAHGHTPEKLAAMLAWVEQCKVCLRDVFQHCRRTRRTNRCRERRCAGGDGSEEIAALYCHASLPRANACRQPGGWCSVSDGNSPKTELY
jgi:hypothetical protein